MQPRFIYIYIYIYIYMQRGSLTKDNRDMDERLHPLLHEERQPRNHKELGLSWQYL